MDRKQLCVANVSYKRNSAYQSKRMRNLLKYLTYRDSRDDYVPQVSGVERWVNRGMGKSVSEIANRCDAYRSEHVLLFSLVFNPNPRLIEMIPYDEREAFVRKLTESTVNDFFDERDIDTGVEFSYVVHHRKTEDGEEKHNPHSHVVLPGTSYDADEGRRVPLYFSRNRGVNHIEMLHRMTESNMEHLLERHIGMDWEARYDALYPEEAEVEISPTISRDL